MNDMMNSLNRSQNALQVSSANFLYATKFNLDDQILYLKNQISKFNNSKNTLQKKIETLRESEAKVISDLKLQLNEAKKMHEFLIQDQLKQQNTEIQNIKQQFEKENVGELSAYDSLLNNGQAEISKHLELLKDVDSLRLTNLSYQISSKRNEIEFIKNSFDVSQARKDVENDLDTFLKKQKIDKITFEINHLKENFQAAKLEQQETINHLSNDLQNKTKENQSKITELKHEIEDQNTMFQSRISALKEQIEAEQNAYFGQINVLENKEKELEEALNNLHLDRSDNMEQIETNIQEMKKTLDDSEKASKVFHQNDIKQTHDIMELKYEKQRLIHLIESLKQKLNMKPTHFDSLN